MPFSLESITFLYENHQQNNRSWYQDHKLEYQKNVLTPMRELIAELTPALRKIDKEIFCDPKRIVSRLFRDLRYCKDKTIFHQNVWATFMRRSEAKFHGFPAFYFEISPNNFNYGCGFYQPETGVLNALRTMILKKDRAFEKALQAFESQDLYLLKGDSYKRDHYPDQKENRKNWLNRKDLCLVAESEDFDLLFSSKLSQKIAEDFQKIVSVYKFFFKAGTLALDHAESDSPDSRVHCTRKKIENN